MINDKMDCGFFVMSIISHIYPDCFHLIRLHSCPPCHTGATWGYTCCFGSGIGFWGRIKCCYRLHPPHPTCPHSHHYHHSANLWGCRSKSIKSQMKTGIIPNSFKYECTVYHLCFSLTNGHFFLNSFLSYQKI